MLERICEPEVMESRDDAQAYHSMDHGEANRAFVADLLHVWPCPRYVLDVGTGTAELPVELCHRAEACRVRATDMSREMLQLARSTVESHGLSEHIELDYCDAKQMPYHDNTFDLVMCNGMLHHIAEPVTVLSESRRVAADGGMIFFRDLRRPTDSATLEHLVSTHVGTASRYQQELFRQSLRAGLDLDEIRATVASLGFDPETVQASSDRHWTWIAKCERDG